LGENSAWAAPRPKTDFARAWSRPKQFLFSIQPQGTGNPPRPPLDVRTPPFFLRPLFMLRFCNVGGLVVAPPRKTLLFVFHVPHIFFFISFTLSFGALILHVALNRASGGVLIFFRVGPKCFPFFPNHTCASRFPPKVFFRLLWRCPRQPSRICSHLDSSWPFMFPWPMACVTVLPRCLAIVWLFFFFLVPIFFSPS